MTTASELSARLADLLRDEHHALAEFLVALASFDAAKAWGDLGHRSLFDYLHRRLGISKGAAFYRMTAAQLIQRHPEVTEPLRSGALCLTSVVELSKVLAPGNVGEVLPRFFHASKREAQAIAAELRPAESVPRRTIVTALAPAPLPLAASPRPEPAVHPANQGDAGQEPVHLANQPAPRLELRSAEPPRATVEHQTATEARLHLTVTRSLLKKLDQARDALSHSHPAATEDQILELGLDLILARHAKRRGIGAKARKLSSTSTTTSTTTSEGVIPAPALPPPSGRSRHVPADVWRAVWARDHGCCAWPLEGGGVCGSTRQVELDHVDGWALGAGTTVEGCRLLCTWHQDVSARKLYGDDLMNGYTKPKGGGCSEPAARYGCSRRPRSDGRAGDSGTDHRAARPWSRGRGPGPSSPDRADLVRRRALGAPHARAPQTRRAGENLPGPRALRPSGGGYAACRFCPSLMVSERCSGLTETSM